jgi:hypothetical protein
MGQDDDQRVRPWSVVLNSTWLVTPTNPLRRAKAEVWAPDSYSVERHTIVTVLEATLVTMMFKIWVRHEQGLRAVG